MDLDDLIGGSRVAASGGRSHATGGFDPLDIGRGGKAARSHGRVDRVDVKQQARGSPWGQR